MAKFTLTVAALVLIPLPAQAAGPQVTGKYAYVSNTYCEAKLGVTKNATTGNVTNVTLQSAGSVASSVGYITFTKTSSTGGTAVISGATLIEGGTLRVNNNGFAWSQKPDNMASTPYSFDNTTFTLAGQTYQMAYADSEGTGASAYFRTVYLVRRESPTINCLETVWATRQPG